MKIKEVSDYTGVPVSNLIGEVRSGRLIPETPASVDHKSFDPSSVDRMKFSPEAVAVFLMYLHRPGDLITMLKQINNND